MTSSTESEDILFTRGDLRTTLTVTLARDLALAVAQQRTTEAEIAPLLVAPLLDVWLEEPVLTYLLGEIHELAEGLPWPFALYHLGRLLLAWPLPERDRPVPGVDRRL